MNFNLLFCVLLSATGLVNADSYPYQRGHAETAGGTLGLSEFSILLYQNLLSTYLSLQYLHFLDGYSPKF